MFTISLFSPVVDFSFFLVNLSIKRMGQHIMLRLNEREREIGRFGRFESLVCVQRQYIDGRKNPVEVCINKKKSIKKKNRLKICVCKCSAYFCIVMLTFHKVVSSLVDTESVELMLVCALKTASITTTAAETKTPYKSLRYCYYLEHNSIYSPFQMWWLMFAKH